MDYELEYNSMYGVYQMIYGDEVILLGSDDYDEAVEEAEGIVENGGE